MSGQRGLVLGVRNYLKAIRNLLYENPLIKMILGNEWLIYHSKNSLPRFWLDGKKVLRSTGYFTQKKYRPFVNDISAPFSQKNHLEVFWPPPWDSHFAYASKRENNGKLQRQTNGTQRRTRNAIKHFQYVFSITGPPVKAKNWKQKFHEIFQLRDEFFFSKKSTFFPPFFWPIGLHIDLRFF